MIKIQHFLKLLFNYNIDAKNMQKVALMKKKSQKN